MKTRRHKFRASPAFTLMEIMLVVGILAIVMAMAIPPIYRGMSKEPMRQSVMAVTDACTAARGAAILQGKPVKVTFRPRDRSFAAEAGSVSQKPGASLSFKFPDSISIEMLDINLMEFRDREEGFVKFSPNGMCDEFTLVLHSDKGEWRKLSMEPATGIITTSDDMMR